MSRLPKCYGIIPSRFQSSRFPGKPLAPILGKPMFGHVYAQAEKCPALSRVVLATDSETIRLAAEALNVPVVMTGENHPSGTDRVLEAAEKIGVEDDAVVVNIQGDEPALDPAMLTELTAPFADADVMVTTPASKLSPAEAQSPDRVKVVFSKSGKALYFSRSPIPFARDEGSADYYGHIGLYAFRMAALRRFVALGSSTLENMEKLEQLRLLENDIPIHVVITEHQSIGVDRPEDIEKVEKIMKATR